MDTVDIFRKFFTIQHQELPQLLALFYNTTEHKYVICTVYMYFLHKIQLVSHSRHRKLLPLSGL